MSENDQKPGDEPLAPWPSDGQVRRDTPAALDAEELARLVAYAPRWRVVPLRGVARLQRTFPCRNFSEAMWFTLKVGEVAETAGQRPTILVEWDHVTVALRTPDVCGPHRGDFNVAFEIDAIYEQRFGVGRPGSRSDA